MGLKAHQNKEEDSGDNVEEEFEEQDGAGQGHQVIPENEIGDEAHLEEDGLDVREESEGGDELPDIPEHGNGQEEIFIEGEPVTKSVEKQSKTKARSNKKKVDKQPTRPASKRKITRPKKFMDAGEEEPQKDKGQ